MRDTFDRFSHVITHYTIIQQREDSHISEFKVRIVFIDGSILECTEIQLPALGKRKYAFQWMNASYELIIRWDNASHHRHIATFPHHKHTGNEKNISESKEMSLTEALRIISGKILSAQP